MKYVLDTNTVSALIKGVPEATSRVRVLGRYDVAVPQPVLAEIEYGLARLSKSKRKARLVERWLVLSAELPRAPWSDAVSESFGAIKATLERKGSRLEDFDIAIAAHAYAHDATLATGDMAHMKRIPGLALEDWTKG